MKKTAVAERTRPSIYLEESPYLPEVITDPEWIIGILASWADRYLRPHVLRDFRYDIQIGKLRKRARLIRAGKHNARNSLLIYCHYVGRIDPEAAQALHDELIIHL